ncbi:MAG: hypothetical protein ABIR98_01800 [Usitatibacter sp.]
MADAFLALAVAATLALVTFSPFPEEARALAFAWVVAFAIHSHRTHARTTGLRLGRGGAISLRDRDGAWHPGAVRDGSFVAPWLTIVYWRPEGARLDRALVILPGMLSREAMRKIRVILKWA